MSAGQENGEQGLYSERSAAATGGAGVGVFKRKAAVIQAVLPVYQHPEKIDLMGFIHDTGNTGNVKMMIVVAGLVKAKYISHT